MTLFKLRSAALPLIALTLASATHAGRSAPATAPGTSTEAIDPAFRKLIAASARFEALGHGYGWAEGPVWIDDKREKGGGFVLFSDVPGNTMYRWSRAAGTRVFMQPSGSPVPADVTLREAGTNGLVPGDRPGTILAADHAGRAIVRIDLKTRTRAPVADSYHGLRFSSPNDLIVASSGDIYFTDPPYGFAEGDASPMKQQKANGVYRQRRDGTVELVEAGLTRPNGIMLSPDEKTLYVANSDPARAIWMAYDRAADGTISNGRIFADVTAMVAPDRPGLPDGLTVDLRGNIYATGPGGVLVFTPQGKQIGLIRTGAGVANVTFGGPGRNLLFLTSKDRLLVVPTLTRGLDKRRW